MTMALPQVVHIIAAQCNDAHQMSKSTLFHPIHLILLSLLPRLVPAR